VLVWGKKRQNFGTTSKFNRKTKKEGGNKKVASRGTQDGGRGGLGRLQGKKGERGLFQKREGEQKFVTAPSEAPKIKRI